jgi:hypothetical protein
MALAVEQYMLGIPLKAEFAMHFDVFGQVFCKIETEALGLVPSIWMLSGIIAFTALNNL